MKLSTKRNHDEMLWREMYIKFAFFPKMLEDGTWIWFKSYQEVYRVQRQKRAFDTNLTHYYLLLRRRVDPQMVKEYKLLKVDEAKNRLETIE